MIELGKQAVLEAERARAAPELVKLLGRLRFRTSYGQNVLRHSIEVAHLCGDDGRRARGWTRRLARRCGLLHDIGKAVDHEMEGGHPQIGAELARRYGERARRCCTRSAATTTTCETTTSTP